MRSTLALAAAVVVLLAAVPLPVAAHVNHVSADPQASPDGTLVAETAFIAADGYLVVHRTTDNGSIGEPIGHVPLSRQGGLKTDVPVTIDSDVWADWETQEVWLVLHNGDGDGGFEPGEDHILETFGQPAGTTVTVAKDDRALVTAETFAPQRLNTSHTAVSVRNATLPTDGAVVIRAQQSGTTLGRTNLSAGSHANVSVPLDQSFLESNEQFTAEAVLVDASGEPLSAGEQSVATAFGVRYRASNASATPTPDLVQTASPTPAGGGGDDSASSETGESNAADGDAGTSGASGPGFGLVAALLALALAALVGRNRV